VHVEDWLAKYVTHDLPTSDTSDESSEAAGSGCRGSGAGRPKWHADWAALIAAV
jgi:hypothetical protein